MNRQQNRRTLLKMASSMLAATTGNLASPFVKAATDGSSPLRLLTIIDSYGIPVTTRNKIWLDSTAIDYALSDANLGTILQPLKAYKENMLVLSGINLDSRSRTGDAATHGGLACHTLGGSRRNAGTNNASARIPNASIDVQIAEYLDQTGNLPARRLYPHLYFSDYASRGATTYCFNKTGNQIRSIAGTSAALSNIFGDNTLNTPLGSANTLVQSDLLNLVSNQVKMLKQQLDNNNLNIKLDAFNNSVDELADHLQLKVESVCDVPQDIHLLNDSSGRDGILKLIAQIFKCDNASCVTYMIGGENINQHRHNFLDSQDDSDVAALLNRNLHAASHRSDDTANKVHELVRIHQSEMIASLMDELQQTIDIDGNTVLDNTVIFWTSAISNNTHKTSDFPFLLLAGKNTNLNGGYHYNCSESTNNDLLTTLAQGMGMPMQSFGGFNQNKTLVTALNNGPISKLLKNPLN